MTKKDSQSKMRYIDTKIWNDHYFANLTQPEQIIFFYLITNSATNISGVYEISIKRIAAETNNNTDFVEETLKKFEKDEKIKYKDGWMLVINFIKHQRCQSITIVKSIQNTFMNAPRWVKDTLSIRYPKLIPNTDTDNNSTIEEDNIKNIKKDINSDEQHYFNNDLYENNALNLENNELDLLQHYRESTFSKFIKLFNNKRDSVQCKNLWFQIDHKLYDGIITHVKKLIKKKTKLKPKTYLLEKMWENDYCEDQSLNDDFKRPPIESDIETETSTYLEY
ncbi:MAG: hypothetical protein CVV49_06245 [Spirochaetae bacterium HGW-Spirochaetae-5]|nr:MAG: hypothetical protein CVV49_06245 [Spirochaetae bacterium HGW-Spirochaetae-5]